MPNFTDSGIEQNLKNLTDEQLDQMIAETQQIRKDSMAQNVGKSLLQGGRAALLASQGQPISSLPQPTQEKKTLTPDEELNIFEKKERIKAKIKAEFGGGGGLQIVQLPGGGFAVVPGGSKSAEGAATDLAGKKDEQGDPIKLDNVKMNATGGLSGDFPKEQDQINRELDEEDQKRFKELDLI